MRMTATRDKKEVLQFNSVPLNLLACLIERVEDLEDARDLDLTRAISPQC